jgi:hypothetical protein
MAVSFRGYSDPFGTVFRVRTDRAPRARQQNEYFGLNGVEVLDGGQRGRMSTVNGKVFTGPSGTAATLLGIKLTLESLDDGISGIFIDNVGDGHPWTNCLLKDVHWIEDPLPPFDPVIGYWQSYTLTIEHLTDS